ncbi:hypothetical protein [Blastococcus sp. SYSU DS0828]
MGAPVVGLGAWCDLVTEEEARRRLLAGAEGDDARAGERATSGWGYAPYVPALDEPVLDPGGISFRVEEFAVLADGRRIRLHDERGFTLGGGADPWQGLTLAHLADDVRTTVLPDDAEDTGDDHPWEWLAELLRAAGVDVVAEDLRGLPYVVEFSDRLRARVPERG